MQLTGQRGQMFQCNASALTRRCMRKGPSCPEQALALQSAPEKGIPADTESVQRIVCSCPTQERCRRLDYAIPIVGDLRPRPK